MRRPAAVVCLLAVLYAGVSPAAEALAVDPIDVKVIIAHHKEWRPKLWEAHVLASKPDASQADQRAYLKAKADKVRDTDARFPQNCAVVVTARVRSKDVTSTADVYHVLLAFTDREKINAFDEQVFCFTREKELYERLKPGDTVTLVGKLQTIHNAQPAHEGGKKNEFAIHVTLADCAEKK